VASAVRRIASYGHVLRNFGALLMWCPKGTARLVLGPLLGPQV
jgi:hypothetical protein